MQRNIICLEILSACGQDRAPPPPPTTTYSIFFSNLIFKMDDRESKISGREYFKSIFIILESTI